MDKIKPVHLPTDNGPHDFVVEWWYFNGHLYDEKGKKYSFMDCFFKVDISKINIPHIAAHLVENIFKDGEYMHFAHSVLTDISTQKIYKEIQNISSISSDTFKRDLLYINYKDALTIGKDLDGEIIEVKPNDFYIKTKNFSLNLESKKRALLEGGHGYVGTPKSGSYYYSFTDMDVSGSVNIKGKNIKVKGKAWMDHQWANVESREKKDKWTWFSFQLENGTEMMCVKYDKGTETDILVDIIDKNGKQTEYKNAKFIPGRNIWKSKKTKTEFPLSWKIEIDNRNIIIEAKALAKKQEMIFGEINYWEGPMKVKVSMNGKKIKGFGYMELVGYPSDYNYLLLKGEEIEENIWHKIKKLVRL